MRNAVTVGVVTVTYSSGHVVDGFLSSLLGQTHSDFVLYLADNASTDETLVQVSKYSDPRIRIIANRENRGIAEANNQGIEAAIGEGCELVLLMNNDTEFESDLIAKLLAGLYEFGCEMIAPKILYFENPSKIWSAGGGMDPSRGYAGFPSWVRRNRQRTIRFASASGPRPCMLPARPKRSIPAYRIDGQPVLYLR